MSKKDRFYVMRDTTLYKGLDDLISYINNHSPTEDMNMIEIGSYIGDSTLVFAKHFKTILAIDPFIDDYDPDDDACNYAPLSKVYEEFISRTKDIRNIHLFRKTSDEAVEAIKEVAAIIDPMNVEEENLKRYDFIYIDGMHTYEQVKKDIQNYLPFVKKGGFIGGHDYSSVWQDVVNAVNEQLGTPDATFQDTSWIKKV